MRRRSHARHLLAAAAAPLLAGACEQSLSTFPVNATQRGLEVASRVDAASVRADVVGLVQARGTEAAVDSPYTPGVKKPVTHVASAKYVFDAFLQAGLVPIRETANRSNLDVANVYVEIPGGALRNEFVLITAHHDAWHAAGADDNGSGLAVLFQAARWLKDTHPKRTIRIVAFDREEQGFLGSREYLRRHAAEQVRIVLNLDCVGFASSVKGSQESPPGLGGIRDTGDFLLAIANEAAHDDASRFIGFARGLPNPVEIVSILAPEDARYAGTADLLRSDHYVFWKAGIPALFLSDTANFRNANYHTEKDLPDTLDYGFLDRVTHLVIGAAAAYAEME